MNNLDVIFDKLEEAIEKEFDMPTNDVQVGLDEYGVYEALRLMLIGEEVDE